MVSPARMTRQPGLTAYLARSPRQPSVSPPKRRPGKPQPSTPARLEREARTEPEHTVQAQASYEAEIEL
jgi:hypothetical protein